MTVQWLTWIFPLSTGCICQCRRSLFLLEVCFAPRFFIHATHSSLSWRLPCYLRWLLQQKLGFFLLLPLRILSPRTLSVLCISSLRPLQTSRNIWLQKGLAWITARSLRASKSRDSEPEPLRQFPITTDQTALVSEKDNTHSHFSNNVLYQLFQDCSPYKKNWGGGQREKQ